MTCTGLQLRETQMADTKSLAMLIQRQWIALSGLHQLVLEQQNCLGSDRIEMLLSLIARKQPLVEELQDISLRLQAYRDQSPEHRVWESPQERARCQAQAKQCEELHSEIVRLEAGALELMEQQRSAIASQLQDCRDSSFATTAYATQDLLSDGGLDLTNT